MNSNRDDTISALADGQLEGDALASAIDRLSEDPEALAAWETYHLVGDVMRYGTSGAPLLNRGFITRLGPKLAAEKPLRMPSSDPVGTLPPDQVMRQASNQGNFNRRALAALAVFGLALWAGLGTWRSGNESWQLAVMAVPVQAPVPGPSADQGMIRDPRLDELLAAHRQAGGATALQMPSGFLRNATFQGTGR